MAHPRFEEARKAFDKAGANTSTRSSNKICGASLGDGEVCMASGVYVETWRGTHYKFTGVCGEGHTTERYGYSEKEVTV